MHSSSPQPSDPTKGSVRFLTSSRRMRLTGAAALAFTLALGACGEGGDPPAGQSGEEASDPVTLGLIPIVDVAPIHLGIERGFFEDAGIDLELSAGQGGAAIVPGVVSGNLDFGFGNNVSVILAAANDLPIRVAGSGVYSTGEPGEDSVEIVVPGDSPMTSAADLVGKTVAVNTLNAIGGIAVNAAVQAAGGDPAGVRYVEMPFPDMNAALANGDVDALWQVEPFVTLAKRNGARVLADPLQAIGEVTDTGDEGGFSTYFTSDQFASENPDVLERFRSALNESLTYAQENPDEVRRIIPTYLEIPEDVVAELVLPKWSPEIDRGNFEALTQLAQEYGLISSPPDLDGILPES